MRPWLLGVLLVGLAGCAATDEQWDRAMRSIPDYGPATRTGVTCFQRSPGVVSCY